MLAREDPPHMAIDKSLVAGRMHVGLGVRVQVMMPMLGGPPQHALLRRRLRQHREHELECAAGREGAMGEIAVIAGADREDPQPVEHEADRDRRPGNTGPDGGDAGDVHEDEGNGGRIDDVVVHRVRRRFGASFGALVGRRGGMCRAHGCSFSARAPAHAGRPCRWLHVNGGGSVSRPTAAYSTIAARLISPATPILRLCHPVRQERSAAGGLSRLAISTASRCPFHRKML